MACVMTVYLVFPCFTYQFDYSKGYRRCSTHILNLIALLFIAIVINHILPYFFFLSLFLCVFVCARKSKRGRQRNNVLFVYFFSWQISSFFIPYFYKLMQPCACTVVDENDFNLCVVFSQKILSQIKPQSFQVYTKNKT